MVELSVFSELVFLSMSENIGCRLKTCTLLCYDFSRVRCDKNATFLYLRVELEVRHYL